MPATPARVSRTGRRGRRTSTMVRIARERIADLFALAEREGRSSGSLLPNRYVRLARRVGSRYNVRLPREYRELYCRGCSTFWVEGRTVRTRLRRGHRVRTCLACGRARRTRVARARPSAPLAEGTPPPARLPEAALAASVEEEEDELSPEGRAEEE